MKKVLVLIAMLALVAGCGGGMVSGGEEAVNTVPFTMTGAGATDSHALDDIGDYVELSAIFLDATGETGGSGSGGPQSINDTASSACLFSATDGDSSQSGWLELQMGTGSASLTDCTDENNCIFCNVDAAPTQTCSISCDGVIASNAENQGEYFDFTLTTTHTFTTEMADITGMVEVGADYLAINTASNLAYVSEDHTGCSTNVTMNGTAGAMSLTDEDASDYEINAGYTIDVTSAEENSPETCVSTEVLVFRATMPDVSTVDLPVDLSFATVTMEAAICDSTDICDLPTLD